MLKKVFVGVIGLLAGVTLASSQDTTEQQVDAHNLNCTQAEEVVVRAESRKPSQHICATASRS